MCGSTGQVTLKQSVSDDIAESIKKDLSRSSYRLRKHGQLQLLDGYTPNHNQWVGMTGWVITTEEPYLLQPMMFGLTPRWAAKKLYLFNARSEGSAFNKENDPAYDGPRGIFKGGAFSDSVKKRRCILPVDYFIEGPEKEKYNKPYLIRRTDRDLTLLGCIWDEWVSKDTGEVLKSYSIITTGAAPLLKDEVGHHRSPLVIPDQAIDIWLNPGTDEKEIAAIMWPFDSAGYEAIQVSPKLKSRANEPLLQDYL